LTESFLRGSRPKAAQGSGRNVERLFFPARLYLESAAFVTRETLHVDGGAHAGHA